MALVLLFCSYQVVTSFVIYYWTNDLEQMHKKMESKTFHMLNFDSFAKSDMLMSSKLNYNSQLNWYSNLHLSTMFSSVVLSACQSLQFTFS